MTQATGSEAGRPATFERTCRRCGEVIRKGDIVVRAPVGGMYANVHADCQENPEAARELPQARGIPAAAGIDLNQVVDRVIARVGTDRMIADRIKPMLAAELSSVLAAKMEQGLSGVAGVIARGVADRLDQAGAELAAFVEAKINEARLPRTLEIKRWDGSMAREPKAHYHPAFEKVLKLASRRKHVFLPGPAGCGKSHMARQVAEALGLAFGMISLSGGVSESKLVGRSVPDITTGKEHFKTTQFVEIFENGGVFLFDELDAADPNVLLIINSALANGELAVDRADEPIAKMHRDFVCIAAANTMGRGADRQYVGRNELDESTLDRFRIGIVPMDYDAELERALCPDDTLRGDLLAWRQRIERNRLERVVSSRFMQHAFEMMFDVAPDGTKSPGPFTMRDVEQAFFAGWEADEIEKVLGRHHEWVA